VSAGTDSGAKASCPSTSEWCGGRGGATSRRRVSGSAPARSDCASTSAERRETRALERSEVDDSCATDIASCKVKQSQQVRLRRIGRRRVQHLLDRRAGSVSVAGRKARAENGSRARDPPDELVRSRLSSVPERRASLAAISSTFRLAPWRCWKWRAWGKPGSRLGTRAARAGGRGPSARFKRGKRKPGRANRGKRRA
jgi:hypothetical protein